MVSFSSVLPFLIAGLFALMVLLSGYLIYQFIQRGKVNARFTEQLQDLLSDETDTKERDTVSISQRWMSFWEKRARESGVGRYADNPADAGREVVVLAGIGAVVGFFLTRNILASVAFVGLAIWGMAAGLQILGNSKNSKISAQLPGFLSSLKANISGRSTNESAFLKVVDRMPLPLRDELAIAQRSLRARKSFAESMQDMSDKTFSNDLRFFAESMVLSSDSGASIIPQLEVIQDKLKQRREQMRKIDEKINQVKPAVLASAFIIPGLFIYLYFSNEAAQEFWFNSMISWIAFIAIVVLYVAGLILTRRMMDKIKDM